VNAAFDAMSAWRTEMVSNSEKNSGQVIEKIAAAARALGWPDQIVEATRAQMQRITKTQIETMDHVMDAWEEQIKSPNPASAMLSKLKGIVRLPDRRRFLQAGRTWGHAASVMSFQESKASLRAARYERAEIR
jgi:hypothetical protein